MNIMSTPSVIFIHCNKGYYSLKKHLCSEQVIKFIRNIYSEPKIYAFMFGTFNFGTSCM